MAVDHWTQEYHLTPSGWVKGTYKFFGKGDEVPRPTDAVETWEEDCRQSSRWSKEDYSETMLWHDPAVPEADRKALRQQFKSPFTDDNAKIG